MNYLRKIVQELGIKQARLSEITGYQSGTVCKHINSEKSPSAEATLVYAKALNRQPKDIRPDLPWPDHDLSETTPDAAAPLS